MSSEREAPGTSNMVEGWSTNDPHHPRGRWPQRSRSPGHLTPWRKFRRIIGMGSPASRYLHGAGHIVAGRPHNLLHWGCKAELALIIEWCPVLLTVTQVSAVRSSVRPSVAVQQRRSTMEGRENFTLCDNIPHRTRVTNSTGFGQKGQRSRSPGHIMLAQVKQWWQWYGILEFNVPQQWWHLANTFTLTWPAQMLLINNCLSRQTIHWAKNVTTACLDLCTWQWFSFFTFLKLYARSCRYKGRHFRRNWMLIFNRVLASVELWRNLVMHWLKLKF